MHAAADDFVSAYPRAILDLEFLLDRPTELVASLLKERAERERFLDLIEEMSSAIRGHINRGLDWGPCHGDLTLDNLHVTVDGQIVFYDFDSGGPGWRASDLPGWAKIHTGIADAEMRSQAFLRGYQSQRPLGEADIEAAPYLYLAFEVWGMEIDLQNRLLARGRDAVQAYLATSMMSLQLHVNRLLRPQNL
jgi:Ser/Thr protein kinase RdoA (MazF antagonist)